MRFTKSRKRELLKRLNMTRAKVDDLEMTLRFKRKIEDAERARKRGRRLQRQIDMLLGHVMADWLGEAEGVENALKKANTSLQAAIRGIEKNIKVSRNVAKAIGYIDDAISLAKDVLAVV